MWRYLFPWEPVLYHPLSCLAQTAEERDGMVPPWFLRFRDGKYVGSFAVLE